MRISKLARLAPLVTLPFIFSYGCASTSDGTNPGAEPEDSGVQVDDDAGQVTQDGGKGKDGGAKDTSTVDAPVVCAAGLADCDKIASNGCEVDTRVDVLNCNGCAIACPGAVTNSTETCVASACVNTCNPGFVKCAAGCCIPPSKAQRMDAGDGFACALTAAGGVQCWGSNSSNKLGTGAAVNTNVATPADVTGLTTGVITVSAGREHACAVTSTGGVKCWGSNSSGQLGSVAVTTTTATPVDVTGLTTTAAAVAAGHIFSCALLTTGSVQCWGSTALGDGVSTTSKVPVTVSGLTNAVAIAAGYSHACALLSTGDVKCWGTNSSKQLGAITTATTALAPIAVPGLTGVAAIATGRYNTCAAIASGAVKCWGSGYTAIDTITNVSNATWITSDYTSACAVTVAGAAMCWGSNSGGQLGDGTNTSSATAAVQVSTLTTGVVSVHAGDYHACALLSTGGVKCWGEDTQGQLGNGALIPSNVPVDVTGF